VCVCEDFGCFFLLLLIGISMEKREAYTSLQDSIQNYYCGLALARRWREKLYYKRLFVCDVVLPFFP